MPALAYHLLDVFTDRPFAGNPLAVVLHEAPLPADLRQRIAREFNLSETIFVQPLGEARVAACIHTPATELPFAGHPLVGAAVCLRELGVLMEHGSFAVPAGEIGVSLRNGHAVIDFPGQPGILPRHLDRATLSALGLATEALVACAGIAAGVHFLAVKLSSRSVLDALRVPRGSLDLAVDEGLYLFAEEPPGLVHARMFAPGLGIGEDPATGSAACALSAWLARELPDGRACYQILQGEAMGRPSRIELGFDVADGTASSVQIGGAAVRLAHGRLLLPD